MLSMMSITYREKIERSVGQPSRLAQQGRQGALPMAAGTDADNGKLTLQPARRKQHAPDL